MAPLAPSLVARSKYHWAIQQRSSVSVAKIQNLLLFLPESLLEDGAAQLAKRSFLRVLLAFAAQYVVLVNVNRDSRQGCDGRF